MDDDRVLGKSVEMRNALDEDAAARRDGRDLAFAHRLVDREQRVRIVPYTLHFRSAFADEARGLVRSILVEELGELAVGGEGGLDGDDDIGGEVSDAGDCTLLLALPLPLPLLMHPFFVSTPTPMRMVAGQRMRAYLLLRQSRWRPCCLTVAD